MTEDRKWELYEEYVRIWLKEVIRLKVTDSVPCSFMEYCEDILEESGVF